MNKTFPYILLLAFHLLATKAFDQTSVSYCNQNKLLLTIFEKHHYQPVPPGSELAQRTYQLFLQSLDPHGLYFIAEDTSILALCQKNLLGITIEPNCDASFKKICDLYLTRLKEADSLIDSLLQHPLDFTKNDSIYFDDNEKMYFANDKATLRKGWNKWIKYHALLYLFSPDSASDRPFSRSSKVLLTREPEIRNKIKVMEKRYIKRILNHPEGYENYIALLLLNAEASSFDPHSSYFSPAEKRDFESSLSTDAPSYGFETEDKPNGTVQISRLVPGGPAWKSNELHKGDVLVQVQWAGGEIVNLSYSDKDEVDEIIQSSQRDRMDLTVKKPNGQLKTVRLIKKVLKTEDNLIKSFVLKGEKTIGYISLPGFYTEWENQDPTGCSNDVAKEIIKLKQDNIEGIIIDLRNNGGGAMNEAIALAGTFIEGGTLCILSEKDKKLTLLKDMSLGTVYDGPLVIMVNGFSASASEIMAASLQDYHRALIVGSTTFGKATGQTILPMDTLPRSLDQRDKGNEGFVKLTVSKFYRLNGVSYQQKGVVPDVSLPAYFDGSAYQEASQPYAFASDSVSRKVKYTPYPALPVIALSEKSKARINANERFNTITTTLDSLRSVMKRLKAVPLSMELFRKKEARIFDAMQLLEKETVKPSTVYKIVNVKFDQLLINLSDYKKEVNDILVKNLQNDIYIEETYHIINDLITYKQTQP